VTKRGAGRGTTRQQRQVQTRHCLMRSAAKLFARHGLDGASIDDVAADAGFTKGAFYANFSSKEELFLAMLEERFSARLADIERVADGPAEDVEEQAREVGVDFARQLAGDPDWQRLFFEFATRAMRREPFRAELVERYRRLRDGITALFERRLRELGVESPLAPETLSLMTFAMANGFALERLLEPDDAPEDLFADMLVVLFAGVRALAAESSSAEPAATPHS